MNDTELDRLLNTWKAPVPPPSLWEGLLTQFPRAEPRRFVRPRRWVLILAAATATLAVGMEESRPNPWSSGIIQFLGDAYEGITGMIETWPASRVVAQVRQSDPKVYVDGQLAGQLKYGPLVGPWGEARIDVQVPGEGVFSITSHRLFDEWVEAGHIRDNTIEFQAGKKTVRIVCNKPIVSSDTPVFALPQR